MVRCSILLFLCGWGALAQTVSAVGARAGLINYLEGSVYVGDSPLVLISGNFSFVKQGQTLVTRNGRAEMLLNKNVFLRMDEASRLRMEDSELSDTQLTLEQGSSLIEVVTLEKRLRVRIRVVDSVTEFRHEGVYRFDAAQGKLKILGGKAEVSLAGRKVVVKRGTEIDLIHGLRLSRFDLKTHDAFHQWAGERSANLFSLHWTQEGKYIWNSNYGMKVIPSQAVQDLFANQREAKRHATSYDEKRPADESGVLAGHR